MPDKTGIDESKFRKFAQRLQSGWRRLHPLKSETLVAVRQAARLQWERRQKRKEADSKKFDAEVRLLKIKRPKKQKQTNAPKKLSRPRLKK